MIAYHISGQINPSLKGAENNTLHNLITQLPFIGEEKARLCKSHYFQQHQTRFNSYANYLAIDAIQELLQNNIDLVDTARIYFDCHDEDGSTTNPFPFIVMIEATDGKVFKEELNTRLDCQWDICEEDVSKPKENC